jgi:hypothetical protein
MQLTRVAMGLILLTLFISPVTAQFLSPTAQLTATTPIDTMLIAIGYTKLNGEITGIDGSTFIENFSEGLPITEYLQTQYNLNLNTLRIYPLISHTTIPNISKITVIDLENSDLSSFDDLIDFYTNNINIYENVHLTLQDGLFIYGTPQQTHSINHVFDNAISGIISLPLDENFSSSFLAMITQQPLNITFSTTPSFIIQTTEQGQLTLTSSDNRILRQGSQINTLLIIEDATITLQQNPPVYLYPIDATTSPTQDIILNISPADSPLSDIPQLLNEIQSTVSTFDNSSSFGLPIEGFDNILDAAASVVNGAVILINTNDTLQIDHTTQHIQDIGLFRGDTYQLTISPKEQQTMITGNFRLIFLGDHLYTAQAPNSDNGITFPWIILIIWIVAIIVLIYTKFYQKNKPTETEEKYYPFPLPLFIHILLLILTFILIDLEISFQFGISAISTLFGTGINEIFALALIIQLIMWIIGYILLTIPTRIILKTLFPYLIHDTTTTKKLANGISLLTIWIFTALYLKLIINILLLYLGQQLPIFPG